MPDRDRLPPGQQLAARGKWPVVGERQADRPPEGWSVRLFGLVDRPQAWSLEALRQLPSVTRVLDIHCVTRWSRFDMEFTGVPLEMLLDQVQPAPAARFISFQAATARNHSTSLPLDQALELGTMLVWQVNGAPLSAEHGGPLRTVVPGRYFYKSLKWLIGMELLAEDRLGYWEAEAGYHNRADPWREERFVAGNISRQAIMAMVARRSFAGEELLGLDAEQMDLSGLDARGARLRNANFRRCRLAGADFRDANLSNASFVEADLRRADFRGADVEGADFSAADLRGADLRVDSLIGATFVSPEGAAARIDRTTRFRRSALDFLAELQQRVIEHGATPDTG